MPNIDLRRFQRVNVRTINGKPAGAGVIVRIHRDGNVSVQWDKPSGRENQVALVSRVDASQCTPETTTKNH